MNNANTITVNDIAKVERADKRTTTGGRICCTKATLTDGRTFTYAEGRMSKRLLVASINAQIARGV